MKAEEFVKQHYPKAYSGEHKKGGPVFIWNPTAEGQRLLGRGMTKSKAWASAKANIRSNQFAVTATNPPYKRLQVALKKAAQEIGWKGLTAELAGWCLNNQPQNSTYSLPWWCREIKYTEEKKKP